jgi:hypothetical protein
MTTHVRTHWGGHAKVPSQLRLRNDRQSFREIIKVALIAKFKRASVHRSNGFVKRCKNPRLPDCLRDAMPIHVGSQV